ncbi:DUF2958 domain-containing protein [Arthrobacter sp. SO3]|uniref:DUF2958 domain-containing protein n=1 Tax=Arthrobacter sp. SO3 TaxID=1897057 RepID=UPI001CFF6695|nr:DUF2958 domain-containing protein [Arthrobacter sp. SO3]
MNHSHILNQYMCGHLIVSASRYAPYQEASKNVHRSRRISTIFDLPETQLTRRGHVFYGDELKTIPSLYETEEVPADDKVIVARFFGGSGTWLIAELDPETGTAFGCCSLGLGFQEWGYVSLLELESLNIHNGLVIIERDLDFTPIRLCDIQR